MTLRQIGLFILIIVGLFCVLLLLINAKSGTTAPQVPECVTDEDRVHIRSVVLQAVDDGLKDQIKFLFANWLKDPASQPHRASAGLQAAIVAYQRARTDALKWTPKSC